MAKLSSETASSRLSADEQAAVTKAMQRAGGAERRTHRRLQLDEKFPLLMRVEGSGITGTFMQVTARDLSASGIGFFHVAYLHPGTPITLIMKSRKGAVATAKAMVLRCEHVSGRVHEVGAAFQREIEVEVFVSVPDQIAEETPVAETADVYIQIAAMADQLKSLASDRVGLDAILDRVGKLALLVSPRDPAVAAAQPGNKDEAKERKGGAAGGRSPSGH